MDEANGDARTDEADGDGDGDGDTLAQSASSGPLAVPDGASWAGNFAAVPSERGADDDPTGTAVVAVTGYAADGTETGTLDVTVPGGTDVDLSGKDLKPLGENVTAIGVTATGDAATVWGLRLADGSLVATLTPPATAVTESTVAARDVVAD
ncbi:hypothetical protein [Myceligenerans indicum]|uniref:Uncharacterized protein n=1 Tax=Myceligenerans indicum TaxID=2593663 RepID=A0ABS1LI23_9MICO|nr:hypothetical protein [Myceligenerans indicum]MBL0885890.1 hypothetical protein [Myceligenerans indicum]